MVNPLRGWGHGRDVTRRLHLRLLTVGPYRGHRADGDAAIITYPLHEGKKSFLTQVRSVCNVDRGALRQQHPHRNLQSPPSWVDDGDRAVSSLWSADNL